MSDNDKTKEELLTEARDKNVEGRSSMNKDELADALGNLENEGGASAKTESTGAQERKDAIEEEAPVAADLAADELDFQGPLHLQAPEERVMTGAVNEEQAKEQEKLLADRPDDFVGEVTEAGFNADGKVDVGQRLASASDRPGYQEEVEAGQTFAPGNPNLETWNDRRDQVLGEKPKNSSAKSKSDES